MRESLFIRKNAEKWRSFEQLLEAADPPASKLSELYLQVSDDLSYARTFYPRRSVRVYLNNLAQKIFDFVYSDRYPIKKKVVRFWSHELPRLMWEGRNSLYLSFGVFLLATLIGLFSSLADENFASNILGHSYVEMTRENIKAGDPMAVYKQEGEFGMFLGITFNNVRVALLAFTLGILFSIGALYILLFNGVMFGAFISLFLGQGLLPEFFLTVMMHGTLELSSIVVAGAAGITLGSGMVFPGTFSRLKAFQASARRGLFMFLGTVPLFVIAGFVEAYFTRHTDAPNALRLAFILLCAAFVIFYFIWYPYIRSRRPEEHSQTSSSPPDKTVEVKLGEVKSSGDIFFESFYAFTSGWKHIWKGAFVGSLGFCLVVFGWLDGAPSDLINLRNSVAFGTWRTLAEIASEIRTQFPLTIAIFVVLLYEYYSCLKKYYGSSIELTFNGGLLTAILAFAIIFILEEMASGILQALVGCVVFAVPVLLQHASGLNRIDSVGIYIKSTFWQIVGLGFTIFVSGALFFLLFDVPLLEIALKFVVQNIWSDSELAFEAYVVLFTFASVFGLLIFIQYAWVVYTLQFFNALEIVEANHLIQQIQEQLSQRPNRLNGLERE